MSENKKRGFLSEEQKRKLIAFLEHDEELKNNKFSNSFTFKESRARWQVIAEQLNLIPGAEKDWAGWKHTWQDMKKNAKKRQTVIKNYTQATGGGPAPKKLKAEEEQILNLIDQDALEGTLVEESIMTDHDYLIDVQQQELTVQQQPIEAKEKGTKKDTRRRSATKRLDESVKTSNKIANILESKNDKKDSYYEKKLILMERDVIAKEKIAETLQNILQKL